VSIPNAPVAVGDVLAGKYRTERLLGVGNMGVVVEALHLGLNQRVALKFLLAHRATQQALHERFLREARAAACLTTQHVTRVFDVGTLDSGAPYMVMELLKGRDLAAVLEQDGPLPVADAVECVLQALEAVGEAHKNGIVHRDLKPANLFLTTATNGATCVKVLDFGVSKVQGAQLKLTSDGQMVGSPLYMSPEQMLAKDTVDSRTDIWALGVLLYELLAGRTPFHTDTMLKLQTQVLIRPPAPLSTYRPDAPAGLEAVILQCLDKKPDRRWPNVAELAAALVPYAPPSAVPYAARVATVLGVTVEPSRPTDVLSLEAAKLRASEPAAGAADVVATTTGAASLPAGVPPKLRGGWLVLGAGAVAFALVLVGVALLHRGAEPSASTASATALSGSAAPPPAVTVVVEPSSSARATDAPTATTAAPARVPVTRTTPSAMAVPSVPPHTNATATTKPQATPIDEPTDRWKAGPRR
jgi:eukaryotic-like serine/threonine-protein kinase